MPEDSSPENEVGVVDFFVVLAENIKLLTLGPLAVGVIAAAISFAITPRFTASTNLLPPQPPQSASALIASQLGPLAGIAGAGIPISRNPADTYVTLVKSRTVADRMIDRFKLFEIYDTKSRDVARKELAHATRVSIGKDGLITIEVNDTSPDRAANLANGYVQELAKMSDGLAITEAQQRRLFFEKQLREAQANLENAQLALSAVGVPEDLIKSSPAAVVESVAKLRALVTAQEIKLSTMRSYLTDQNPELQRAQRELESLKAELNRANKDKPDAKDKHGEYLNRYRDFKYQETLFEVMANQYASARLDESREGNPIQVVDVAIPPEIKSTPKRLLIVLLTMIASEVFLILYVFVGNSYRNARRDPSMAEKLDRITSAVRVRR